MYPHEQQRPQEDAGMETGAVGRALEIAVPMPVLTSILRNDGSGLVGKIGVENQPPPLISASQLRFDPLADQREAPICCLAA